MPSHKRKRSASQTSRASSHPAGDTEGSILNPHAHSESTLKQLRVAGLTDAALLPSTYIPHFPHRHIGPSHLVDESEDESEDDDDDDDNEARQDEDDDDDSPADDDPATTTTTTTTTASNEKARRAKAMRTAQDTQLALLIAALHRFLEAGDIARAKRVFGLVRRSEVRGKAVDLRRGGLWGLGLEVLMREGEEEQPSQSSQDVGGEGEDQSSRKQKRRWGAAANMPAVRAYLEGLVRLYPYNRLHPKAVSDLHFYPVLFGCEVYNTWAEHRLALQRLEQEDEEDVAMADEDEDEDEDEQLLDAAEAHLSGRERRARRTKAELALAALGTMREVATRMDALLANVPYSRSAEMLRLRGMVALYMGDLKVPPPPRADEEEEEGLRMRDEEREQARRWFRKMRDHGGRVDGYTVKWLDGAESGADDDNEDMESAWGSLPVFSSLPVRN
ncbi:unnamed protein product [Discula destructiva]